MTDNNEYCEKHCKGYRDTDRCFADGRCDEYWEYQKQKGTMTFEELNEGNLLVKQIIDAENELRELEEWQKSIEEDDEMVWLSSKEKTGRRTKSICILNGKGVLPLIQERIEEVKERLVKKRANFEKL